eukprot:scaffold2536_cov169-Amphora_coffeaeformis.AAC.4
MNIFVYNIESRQTIVLQPMLAAEVRLASCFVVVLVRRDLSQGVFFRFFGFFGGHKARLPSSYGYSSGSFGATPQSPIEGLKTSWD